VLGQASIAFGLTVQCARLTPTFLFGKTSSTLQGPASPDGVRDSNDCKVILGSFVLAYHFKKLATTLLLAKSILLVKHRAKFYFLNSIYNLLNLVD
jgi:hypothetical protein